MSRSHRHLARTGVAGLAVGVASVLAAGTAPPAGAVVGAPTAPAAPAPPPVQPTISGSTSVCLVGAAIFYPFFIGNILFADPASVPSAAPGYWIGHDNGGKAGPGDQFHGWLPACGLPGGIAPPKAG